MPEIENQSLNGDDSLQSEQSPSKIPIESKKPIMKNGKWLDNNDEIVEEVFGFNENSELINGRAAMIGFLMLVLTELVFKGEPVTSSIFAIN